MRSAHAAYKRQKHDSLYICVLVYILIYPLHLKMQWVALVNALPCTGCCGKTVGLCALCYYSML